MKRIVVVLMLGAIFLAGCQADSGDRRVLYESVRNDINDFDVIATGKDTPAFSLVPSDAKVIVTSLRGAYKEAVNNGRDFWTSNIDRSEFDSWLIGLHYEEIKQNNEMVLPFGGFFILEERVIQEADGSYFGEAVIGKLKEPSSAACGQETPIFQCERIRIQDHNGNQAIVDFFTLTGNKRWGYGSSEKVVDDGDGSEVDMSHHLSELSGYFSELTEVITLGMASQEGERVPNSRLSNQRGETLQDLLRPILGRSNTNVPVYRLNLGQYTRADHRLSREETSDQRRVVIIGVVKKHPNTALESALERWFLDNQDDLTVDIREYSNYAYGEPLDIKLF